MLKREGFEGAGAYVIGDRGIREALSHVGIRLLDGVPAGADLVVVGWDRSVDYEKLRTASLLVERGARLVATNADASYPAPDGLWPGAGAILAAITTTTGSAPTIVGKPARPLFEAAIEVSAARHPLVVGDRLDTDIRGASAMGLDSLLVLSGASTATQIVKTADAPTYVGADLGALLQVLPPARIRAAGSSDAYAIEELLSSVGLSEMGAQGRLGDTIVSAPGTGPRAAALDATACLQRLGGYGILRSVAVRSALQGKGLGTLIVAATMRRARSEGIGQVVLFTRTGTRFFERLGFQATARALLPEPIRTGAHAAEECAESATPMILSLRKMAAGDADRSVGAPTGPAAEAEDGP
jgi:N-acetylglutamate synthase-like GNAT family acetyltransferase